MRNKVQNKIKYYKADIVNDLISLIKIKSVEGEAGENTPFGIGPKNALNHILAIGNKMGFKTINYDNYVGEMSIGNSSESIGILTHVDVVPAGDDWDYPPYEGKIINDKIVGRGATDNKGPAIAALYSMKILRELDIDLKKKIRLIVGTNEETGWGCMDYFKKVSTEPDVSFTPDANFPVIHGEKGIMVLDLVKELGRESKYEIIELKAGHAVNMVPDYAHITLNVGEDLDHILFTLNNFKKKEKYNLKYNVKEDTIKIITGGVSAHGSTPEMGENAITYLIETLKLLFDKNDSIGEFIHFYSDKISFNHNGEKIGCYFKDNLSGDLKFNPGVLQLKDNKLILSVNIRYPVTFSDKDIYEGIEDSIKHYTDIKLRGNYSNQEPLYIDKKSDLVVKLMDVYREVTGDVKSEPLVIGGGTYARAFKNAVAFGPVFPWEKELAHQKNEYIEIDSLLKLVEIYALALYELLN